MIKSLQLLNQQFSTSLENQTSQRVLQLVPAISRENASPQNTLHDISTKQERYKNIPYSLHQRLSPDFLGFSPPLNLTEYLANLLNGHFSLLNKAALSIQIWKTIKDL